MSTVSSEFGAFSIVPKELLLSNASANAIRAYLVLYHYSTMKDGALPSRATIARNMGGISRDTVDRALKELVEGGWLTITHRWILQDRTVSDEFEPGAEPTTSHYHLRGSRTGAHRVSALVRPPSRKDAAHNENEVSENETNEWELPF